MAIIWKILLAAALLFAAFAVYVVAGVIISYKKQPPVSAEYAGSFNPGECFGEGISGERARVLDESGEALTERLRLIDTAEKSIILSTFSFHADESGKDVLCALLAAAKRGVTVKIIADGAPGFISITHSAYFHGLAAMKPVEIKIYNPLNFLAPWKLMGRLHDKYLIIDDRMYILGGRNTYDAFLGNTGRQNHDRDVLVYNTEPGDKSASLFRVKDYFESVWNYGESKPVKGQSGKKAAAAMRELGERYAGLKLKHPTLAEPENFTETTYETRKITLLSNPIHVYAKEPTLFFALTELMKARGSGNIDIHTPYVICNGAMYSAFSEICESNRDTCLMTNSAANNGNPFGAADYVKNKSRLINTGLKISEYEGGISYHGKSIAIGDRLAVIGSFNMDMRSVYLDTELMLVIDSEKVTARLRECMAKYEAQSVKAIDAEHYETPGNVTRQELTPAKKRRIKLLNLFSWIRFLT